MKLLYTEKNLLICVRDPKQDDRCDNPYWLNVMTKDLFQYKGEWECISKGKDAEKNSPENSVPIPEENIIDIRTITKQLRINAEELMKEISAHADRERDMMQIEISMLKAKVKYLEKMLEALIRKVEEPILSTDYGV